MVQPRQFVHLDDIAAAASKTEWCGRPYGRIDFDDAVTGPLHPRLFRQERVTFAPPHWPMRLADGRWVAGGLTVIPREIVQGAWSDGATDHGIDLFLDETKAERLAEAFFLGGHPSNYYHWLFDDLPRLLLYRGSPLFDPARPIAIRQSLPPFAIEMLRLTAAGLPIVLVRDDGPVHVDRAVVCSFMTLYHVIHPLAVVVLRDALHHLLPPSQGRRLYLSRRDARMRRIRNEDRLIEALRGRGFEAVELAGRPVVEQFRLFASAEAVVAPHGAGLANCVMMPPKAMALVELFPNCRHPLEMYRALTGIMLGRYRRIMADPAQTLRPGFVGSDFTVDTAAVLGALDGMGIS